MSEGSVSVRNNLFIFILVITIISFFNLPFLAIAGFLFLETWNRPAEKCNTVRKIFSSWEIRRICELEWNNLSLDFHESHK